MCDRCEDYHKNHVAFGVRYGELMTRELEMTYHDAQGNEIEDLEMDNMRVEHCWLCGHTTIYESGLCAFCYFWAEDNTPADASEDEIREAYRAKKDEPRKLGYGRESSFLDDQTAAKDLSAQMWRESNDG